MGRRVSFAPDAQLETMHLYTQVSYSIKKPFVAVQDSKIISLLRSLDSRSGLAILDCYKLALISLLCKGVCSEF